MVTAEAVGCAWKGWNKLVDRCKIIIKSFRVTGISLPVGGSCDHVLDIKGFAPNQLVIADWVRSEEEAGYGILESENAVLAPARDGKNVVYGLQDESANYFILASFY